MHTVPRLTTSPRPVSEVTSHGLEPGMDFAVARLNMVESQIRTADVTNLDLQDAFRRAKREQVVPESKDFATYADGEIEYAPGRWLLRPRDIAKLLQALHPRAGQRALAIAAPYAALVLKELGLEVDTHDGEDLKSVPAGPFDLIVAEGGVGEVPTSWLSALAPGGVLGVVVRMGAAGQARLYENDNGGIGFRRLFDAMPPVNAGLEAQENFTF
jgi:protein-L-isoaspartate(D-aspartate) O-methyltransferase